MRSLNNSLVPACVLASLGLILADGSMCQAQTSAPPKEGALEADAATAPSDHHKDGGRVPRETPSTITLQSKAEQAAEERIRARLEKEVGPSKFSEEPLADVLDHLSQVTGVPIQIDMKALEDASIVPDSPVTRELSPVSLEAGLTLLLEPLDLTWIIKDEVLLVTTPEKASNNLVTKVYPVRDLVSQRSSSGQFELIDIITSTLAPTTWDEVGGPGSIQVFRASGALVVSQIDFVHHQIEALLAALRETRDTQGISRGTTSVAEPLQKVPQSALGHQGASSGPPPLIQGAQPAADIAAPASK